MGVFCVTELKPQDQFFSAPGGTSIVAAFVIPGEKKPYVFAELQTLSYSIHREKRMVRVLGTPDPIGYTYGPRTIAGSLIFASLDEHVVARAMKSAIKKHPRLVADQIPPFHIAISAVEELGKRSKLTIYNCTIVDEGQIFSVENFISETTMGYMASSIDLMRNEDTPGRGSKYYESAPLLPSIDEASKVKIGGILSPANSEDAEGIKIIVTGPDYVVETFTWPDGRFLIDLPERTGNIRIDGYRNEHTESLGQASSPKRVSEDRTIVTSNDLYKFELGKTVVDPDSVRVWVDDKEVTSGTSSLHKYALDSLYGEIIFSEPIDESSVVEVSYDYFNNMQSFNWGEAGSIPPGVFGSIVTNNGDPIADYPILMELSSGNNVAVTSGEDGRFLFNPPKSEVTSVYIALPSGDKYTIPLPQDLKDNMNLGQIVLEGF